MKASPQAQHLVCVDVQTTASGVVVYAHIVKLSHRSAGLVHLRVDSFTSSSRWFTDISDQIHHPNVLKKNRPSFAPVKQNRSYSELIDTDLGLETISTSLP